MGIEITSLKSEKFQLQGVKKQRLIQLWKEFNADTYLSGPAAKSYIDPKNFELPVVKLNWMNYSVYMPYQQLYGAHESSISILDLLFSEGPNAI